MKTKAKKNPNRNRFSSSAYAALSAPLCRGSRTAGETIHTPPPRNNLPLPGFVVGALEPLGYTSTPVLGSLLAVAGLLAVASLPAVALPLGATNRGPWCFIHRKNFSALIFARSHGVDCTASRWRSNHATQKIHLRLNRARSLHRSQLRPRHRVPHHVPHHVQAAKMSRSSAGPLPDS